ncbi:MAG: hypothetical protein E6772_06100 [Dysgonomonas sp.]|nr:hypothetical protein [Dysgonomonas sp.]
MEENRDPRIQIYANLDNVQNEIEKAAKDRKSEIKQEAKDQINSLKDEVKDLKDEAKESFKNYKEMKKDSDDPLAKEKISTAKEASKVIEKGIDNDYEQTKNRIEKEAEFRLNSIDNMLEENDESIDRSKNNFWGRNMDV